jgi:Cft2 family RNA processing exonuclease
VKGNHSIQLTPIGGGREIGANSYLLSYNGYDVLLDCGVHPKKEGLKALPDFSLLRRSPDAVLISHGHVDHCGSLPHLLKQFPQTTAYTTRATMAVMDCMLRNSVSVMKAIARERGILEYPLYNHEDVDFALNRCWGQSFEQPFECGDFSVEFSQAGHVLGSATTCIKFPGHTVLYTGDICTTDQELMAGLDHMDGRGEIDTLVIESTYGANVAADNSSYQDQTRKFAGACTPVLEEGGAILVPAFALGRTQEMLNMVARLQDEGDIPDVPVYASGLGRAVYEVYNRHANCLHPSASLQPLERFGRLGDVYDRGVIQDLISEPCIIIATSGMMIERTPSALVAAEMIREKRHGIFFVGYVDADTLGYRVLHAKKGTHIKFDPGRPAVEVRTDNIRYFHFSAHAPRLALQNVITRANPRNVIFVHGDPEAIDWMYEESSGHFRKFAPAGGETITVEV